MTQGDAADRASITTDIALRVIETTGSDLSELHNDSTTVPRCVSPPAYGVKVVSTYTYARAADPVLISKSFCVRLGWSGCPAGQKRQ